MLLIQSRSSYQAGRHSTVGSTSDSRARGPGLDIRSGHILSFLLQLIQEGQLSDTGKCICILLRRS